jgi:predicted CxxxxCH...CXXCH cytochrome family protein
MRAALALLAAAACSAERPRSGQDATVHAPGILDPASDGFHGKVLASQGWDVAGCEQCHDASKVGAPPACDTCHADSPAGCTSCHGQPPATGAHAAHVAKGYACATCHPVPSHWRDPGHLASQAILAFAPSAGPSATFDGARCQNVACHGAGFTDAAATNTTPAWDGGPSQAACGTCHGAPPSSHGGGYACATCHPADAPHVDGVVQVGRTSGCDGCHGSAASPAPPVDLAGDTLITAIGVGAHQAHLNVPSGLRGPISCDTCHAVPAAIDSAGHIDSGPPAEVNAAIGWDRASVTCATWCHEDARPIWTKTGGATCGSCHGLPPADNMHLPTFQLTDCHTCHPGSVDANGFPIVTDGPNGPTSEHINGHVDL